jgi:dTDP-glucose pyrophosphorylase
VITTDSGSLTHLWRGEKLKKLMQFDHMVCPKTTSVQDAIRRIDSNSPHLFQIIVDQEMRVVGTLTDGDIRRGFARGMQLNATVGDCMHVPPVIGRDGEGEENWRKLSGCRFLPVCTADGHLHHILLEASRDLSISRALVMAGGFGKRLGARTQQTPKPLLEVGGKPILAHILDRLIAHGVQEINVSVHYLADQIEDFVTNYDSATTFHIIRESEPLGTAGALGLLAYKATEPILIINGDVLSDLDLNALLDHHVRQGCAGTIAASRFEYQVPYGVLEFDEQDTFKGMVEKPRFQYLVSAGVYYLDPMVARLVSPGERIDMPELIQLARQNGMRITIFPVHENWTDIGQPKDFERADKLLKDVKPRR